MKAGFLICSVFMALLLIGCVKMERKSDSVLPGSQHSQTFEKTVTRTVGCKYLLFLPAGYGEKKQHWPMILFLHGSGERGSDLEKLKKCPLPRIVENQKNFPFIVVSPQCPEGQFWTEKVEVLINLLGDIAARYDVDTERIYLTGSSMGGTGRGLWPLPSLSVLLLLHPFAVRTGLIWLTDLKMCRFGLFTGQKTKLFPSKNLKKWSMR